MGVGAGQGRREIAFIRRAAASSPRPGLVWLSGFGSDMASTKATALDAFARENGRALLRFDYSGHGASSGRFEEGCVGAWLEDALAIVRAQSAGPQILVGSSMGGWIALLLARALHASGEAHRLAAMVLIAPAVDFTERLIWARLPEAARADIQRTGQWRRPSQYGDAMPVTRRLIEEGRDHLLMDAPIRSHCPVHILQGMSDPDVPWSHAMSLMERLAQDQAAITLIKDGEHRLSRPQDIALLLAAVDAADRPAAVAQG